VIAHPLAIEDREVLLATLTQVPDCWSRASATSGSTVSRPAVDQAPTSACQLAYIFALAMRRI